MGDLSQGNWIFIDLSFAVQALALHYLLRKHASLAPGVYDLPAEIDRQIAHLKLETAGLRIDTLTPAQREYLRSWH